MPFLIPKPISSRFIRLEIVYAEISRVGVGGGGRGGDVRDSVDESGSGVSTGAAGESAADGGGGVLGLTPNSDVKPDILAPGPVPPAFALGSGETPGRGGRGGPFGGGGRGDERAEAEARPGMGRVDVYAWRVYVGYDDPVCSVGIGIGVESEVESGDEGGSWEGKRGKGGNFPRAEERVLGSRSVWDVLEDG